jgi:hypothetical protein
MKAVFDHNDVKKIEGPNLKKNELVCICEIAEAVRQAICAIVL